MTLVIPFLLCIYLACVGYLVALARTLAGVLTTATLEKRHRFFWAFAVLALPIVGMVAWTVYRRRQTPEAQQIE